MWDFVPPQPSRTGHSQTGTDKDEAQIIGDEEVWGELPVFGDLRVSADQLVEIVPDAFGFDVTEYPARLRQFVVGRALSDALWLVDDGDTRGTERGGSRLQQCLECGPAGHFGLLVEGGTAEGGEVGFEHTPERSCIHRQAKVVRAMRAHGGVASPRPDVRV